MPNAIEQNIKKINRHKRMVMRQSIGSKINNDNDDELRFVFVCN